MPNPAFPQSPYPRLRATPLTWLIPTYGIPSHSPKEEIAF